MKLQILIVAILTVGSLASNFDCGVNCMQCDAGVCGGCWRHYLDLQTKHCVDTPSPDTNCKLYVSGLPTGKECMWCDKDYYSNLQTPDVGCTKTETANVIKNCRWTSKAFGKTSCFLCTENSSPGKDLSDCSGKGIANCHIAYKDDPAKNAFCLKCNKGYTSIDGTCKISTAKYEGCNLVSGSSCQFCNVQQGYYMPSSDGYCIKKPSSSSSSSASFRHDELEGLANSQFFTQMV